MKKYAFILMGNYDINEDKCAFKKENMETYIFTVKNYDDAKKLVLKLYYEDFGAIETCGAFSKENIEQLLNMTNNDIPIARVISEGEVKEKMDNFFKK